MNIYRKFAHIYASGPYPGYSLTAIDLLPALFERYHVPTGGRLLDIACGEGSFTVAMAASGWQAHGIDQSPDMIAQAQKLAASQSVVVEYAAQDMRAPFPYTDLDLITCWYDSLNYLLDASDLERTFRNAFAALKAGGFFLFDMNTIHGLAVGWMRQACYVQQDASGVFEAHRTAYDYERQVASVHITAFVQQGDLWERMDELHQERGYPLAEIKGCLQAAGFETVEEFGSLRELTPPKPDSGRVWFLARRPA